MTSLERVLLFMLKRACFASEAKTLTQRFARTDFLNWYLRLDRETK